MRTVRTRTVEALEAYYAGAFEASDPFKNKMSWIVTAIEAGYLEAGTHPRTYSNMLKELEIDAPEAKSGIHEVVEERHVYDERRDVYIFFANKKPFEIKGEDVQAMKRCYTRKPHGLGYTINEVCKHFTIARSDFQFIRRELGWTQDQDEFTNEEHKSKTVDDMLDDRVERSRWLLEQAEKDRRFKELEAKAKAWEAWEHMEKASENSEPLRVELDASAPNGQRVAVVMLADLHIGEGGESQAKSLISRCITALRKAYAEADRVVLCFGGDYFHADTYFGTTTKGTPVSKMPPEDAVDLGYSFMYGLLEHTDRQRTDYIIIAGNHDRYSTSHMVNNLRGRGLKVNAAPYEVAAVQAGKNCVFGFVHGDLHRGKPEAVLMEMLESGAWANRPFRAVYSGHKHHKHVAQFNTRQEDVQGTLFIRVASPNTHRGTFERQMGYLSGHYIQVDVWSDVSGKVAEFIY